MIFSFIRFITFWLCSLYTIPSIHLIFIVYNLFPSSSVLCLAVTCSLSLSTSLFCSHCPSSAFFLFLYSLFIFLLMHLSFLLLCSLFTFSSFCLQLYYVYSIFIITSLSLLSMFSHPCPTLYAF